jgi:lipopolysaccharide transport system ATP-binding protein
VKEAVVSDIAIQVRQISKQYRLGMRKTDLRKTNYKTLRESLTQLGSVPFTLAKRLLTPQAAPAHSNQGSSQGQFWALQDISFDVRQGEILGLIGRNGAGKSTLLKILSRVTMPTTGEARVFGRIGSLLEVGTGFHPELTGRENIFLYGAILGMRRHEIERKFDEIVAFTEVEQFVDTPIKHFSSGMYLRMGFSVAAHLETEVLLVDEVLAVGDATFQRKCIDKILSIAKSGRTIIFVSHNMAAVRQLCSTALLLSQGKIVAAGTAEEVIQTYSRQFRLQDTQDIGMIVDRKGAGDFRITGLRLRDAAGAEVPVLTCGEPAQVALQITNSVPGTNLRVAVSFLDALDQRVMHLDSMLLPAGMGTLGVNGELVCHIPQVLLAPGRYTLEILLQANHYLQDHISNAATIEVIDGNFFGSGKEMRPGYQVAVMPFDWTAQQPALAPVTANNA